jgi:AcrR family transcriptional regulator
MQPASEISDAPAAGSTVLEMGGVRNEKAAQTRRRVLAAARRLFAEKGFFVTSTSDIVDAAGVGTRGALYSHFKNREELFLAVFEAVEADLGAKAAVRVTGTTWHSRLDQALAAFLDASLEPEVRRILLIDGPAVLGWEKWREVDARYGLGALKLMLDEGNAEGSIAVADTDAMSHLLLSVINEAALFIAHAKQPRKARKAVGASVAALVAGLAAD